MMEKLGKDFYRVEVPLPNNPLRMVNSYFIKGPGRNLVIDTGMNRKECLEGLEKCWGLMVDSSGQLCGPEDKVREFRAVFKSGEYL